MAEKIELGGGIELVDFSQIEPAKQVIVKKMVGSYAKQISEKAENYEKLSLTLKNQAEAENAKSYQLLAELSAGGEVKTAETTASNLFVGIDEILKNLTNQA